jgi:arylsulfatase A-like enzyme
MNLLIFGIDSLRSDHMSCYGYHRLTTPHIDKIARQGILFEDAYSPYIPTTPGYTTMLSGKDVMSHQMVSLRPKRPINQDIHLLPEILKEKGYVSVCIGFNDKFFRGFDKYESYSAWMSWNEAPGHKAENLNKKVLPLIDSMAKKPFFIFLRHMDPHAPYLPPNPFPGMFYQGNWKDPSKKDMEPVFTFEPFSQFYKSWMPPEVTDSDYIVALYDASLSYMDICIRHIYTRLEELDLIDNTLVVITSDHGESLMEHNCYFDHHGLYEPTIHIPLIYSCPNILQKGKRVKGFVLQSDLTPTVLELMGYHDSLDKLMMDGKSAIPLLKGNRKTNHSEFYISECTWMRKRGWVTPEWKLIEALEPDFHNKPELELYNLIADPKENQNLAESEHDIIMLLKKKMLSWIERRMAETGLPDPIMDYSLGVDLKISPISEARQLQRRKSKENNFKDYVKARAYALGYF